MISKIFFAVGVGCLVVCIVVAIQVLAMIVLAMIGGGRLEVVVGPEGYVEAPWLAVTIGIALYFLYRLYREWGGKWLGR